MFPPLPSWDGLHPLVIHFPIALLMVAPLFLLLGMVFRRGGRLLPLCALMLMFLGTVASYVAVETGEAARDLLVRTPEITAAIESHEELADLTRSLFTVLTVILAALVLVPVFLGREREKLPHLAMHAIFLLIYAGGLLVLLNAAAAGGRIVHELGAHAGSGPASSERIRTPGP